MHDDDQWAVWIVAFTTFSSIFVQQLPTYVYEVFEFFNGAMYSDFPWNLNWEYVYAK